MRLKTVTLALVATLLALLAGFEVAAYLTIPQVHLDIEGDGILLFDKEVGMVPRPSAYSRRVDGPTPNRPALINNIYTDDRGARVDGPGEKSPAKVDVVTIGCSFTWGHGVDNRDTYAARLRRELAITNSNFAMASYGTVQSLQMLNRNADLKPRLVIYGLIYAHLDRNIFGCAPSYYPFCFDVPYVAWDKSGAMRIEPPTSDGVRRFQAEVKGDYKNPVSWFEHGVDVLYGRVLLAERLQTLVTDPAKKEAAFAMLMADMQRAVADMGAELLVVWIPTTFEPPPDMVPRVLGKTRYLDTTQAFIRHRDSGGVPLYIPDDGHPNPAAHALIADEIARYIRREKLL